MFSILIDDNCRIHNAMLAFIDFLLPTLQIPIYQQDQISALQENFALTPWAIISIIYHVRFWNEAALRDFIIIIMLNPIMNLINNKYGNHCKRKNHYAYHLQIDILCAQLS